MERARKDLVRERIRLTTNKISELTTNWIEYEKAVNDVLPSEASERVLSLVAKSRETKFLETKWRHTEKINKLIKGKKESGSDADLSGEQLKNG